MTGGDLCQIRLERFRGPFDLLLHLIRQQRIDVFDIPIARITEQFLHAIRDSERLELERAGEFLELAATLVRIKAQLLLPRRADADGEEEDPRAELVRRLLEFEHFREAARLLSREERDRSLRFARGFVEVRLPRPASDLPLDVSWDEVWGAIRRLAERGSQPEPTHLVAGRTVRIEDKIELILATLSERQRVEFAALVAPWGTRIHAVVSLLACLELAKRNAVVVRQTGPFMPLWVLRPRPRSS